MEACSVVQSVISILGAVIGAYIGGRMALKSASKQIEANKEEAEKQRAFEAIQSQRKFIIQRKIEAYEFALKVLPEFPKNAEMLHNAWAAASLLYIYLPKDKIKLASSFDLIGLETVHIPPRKEYPPNPLRQKKWAEDYNELRSYINKEISALYNNELSQGSVHTL